MCNWNMAEVLPMMLTGRELKESLKVLPEYESNIREQSQAVRLMALNDIYKVYLPSEMSCEIYSKIYLAMLRSLQKKGTKLATQQKYANFKGMKNNEYTGLVGGSDSFSIIGSSGIGKSSAISRAINIATDNKVIELQNPYCRIIPSVVVQTPFDCSVKSLLLEILRQVDESLDTHYFDMAVRAKSTVDILIGLVSQVALNHIGLLVVDEIQNILNHKQGKSLVGCLTQLINNSGISICMVGVPEVENFFMEVEYLARRSLGLNYGRMEYNSYFREFCEVLFSYQYVKNQSSLSDGMLQWLYEHSGGVLAVVVSLIHSAQEISILNGREVLDLVALEEAYSKRLIMLHNHIQPAIQVGSSIARKSASKKEKRNKVTVPETNDCALEKRHSEAIINVPANKDADSDWSFAEMAARAKKEQVNIINLLIGKVSITEVCRA